MKSYLDIILNLIKEKNPTHAAKIYMSLNDLGEVYTQKANSFFEMYALYLEKENKTLSYGVDCYLKLINDMIEERIEFIRNGTYSNTSFDEVEKKVYGNPAVMTYHMHGLVLAQFLWFDQFQRFSFFYQNLKKYSAHTYKYLEIGGGHGLYLKEAIELLPDVKQFDLVDISQSSLDLAKGILGNDKINFILKNVYDFNESENSYDFITIGEVLEHLEKPLQLLRKIILLLRKTGICYITTPINAPMIDHLYLFNNEDEIRDLIDFAGFEILQERIAISDNKTVKYAQKYKIPIMYAAFVKPKNRQ